MNELIEMGLGFKLELFKEAVLSKLDFIEMGLLYCEELILLGLDFLVQLSNQCLILVSDNGNFLLFLFLHFNNVKV
jgi:hypothetical protein